MYASPLQRELQVELRKEPDRKKKHAILEARLLSQLDDMWAAVVTCLDMFCGGGAWRRNMASARAWRKAGHSISGMLPSTMRVALPPGLVAVLQSCLGGADGAVAVYLQRRVLRRRWHAFVRVNTRSEDGVAHARGFHVCQHRFGAAPAAALGKAESCYRDAVAVTQNQDPRALNNLGVLCAQTGDQVEARRCFELAMALDASYQEANSNLVRLRDGGASGGKLVLDERSGATMAFDDAQAAGAGDRKSASGVQPVRHEAGQRLRMLVPGAAGKALEDVEVEGDADSDGAIRLKIGHDALLMQESELVAHCTRSALCDWRQLSADDASRIDIGTRLRGYDEAYSGSGVPPVWREAPLTRLSSPASPILGYSCTVGRVRPQDQGRHANSHRCGPAGRDAVLALVRALVPRSTCASIQKEAWCLLRTFAMLKQVHR